MKKFFTIIMITILVLGITGCTQKTKYKATRKEQYEIRFLSEGKELQKYYVNEGDLLRKPADPIKDGYTFSHWATHEHSIDGSEKFDFNTPITTHTTLFAHFEIDKQPTIDTKTNNNNNDNNHHNSNSNHDNSNNSISSNKSYGYEAIYNEYSVKLKNECPNLSMMECAALSNEGVAKMAEYMYKASGKEGQYATYESWATKLYDVYLQEVR